MQPCYFLKQNKIICLQLTSSICYLSLQEQHVHALQARVGAGEQALAALEQTATEQMEGLTKQSSHALDRLQRQLGQAYSQLEQLHSFIKVLYQRGKGSMVIGPEFDFSNHLFILNQNGMEYLQVLYL